MTNLEIAQTIRLGLFADRDTVKEALDYAFRVIDALQPDDKTAATTAMMIVLNTVAKEILKNEGVK